MRTSIPLVRLMGVPIRLNLSWFITFGFVILLLSSQVYPEWLPAASTPVHWLLGVASGLLFFACILLHELAHSLVARAYGIPVKGITLFVFGGVAQISKEASRPLVEFLMALAGPAMSMALAAVLLGTGLLIGLGSEKPFTVMWEWLLLMNLGVALFNMAPGFPLDGGRVLRSVLWGVIGDYRRATFFASWCGRIMAYALIFIGLISIFRAGWLSPGAGLWFMFLGIFLEGAARQSWQQTQVLDFLRNHKAANIMSRDIAAVPPWVSLDEAVRRNGENLASMCLFVTENERVLGILCQEQLRNVPRERWQEVTVRAAMKPAQEVATVDRWADCAAMVQLIEAEEQRHLPVVEQGRLVAVVSREAILRLLLAKRVLR